MARFLAASMHNRSTSKTVLLTVPRMIIVATEANRVYALDAITGNVIWQRKCRDTRKGNGLPCPGNINPLGITGTPVVDLGSRALFFDAMVVGSTIKHLIFSLNVDTGATRSGWPVHLERQSTLQWANV